MLLMLSTAFVFPGSFKSLLGNDSYKGSKVNRYDIILKDYKDFEKNKKYYVYESFPKKDYNFLSYLSKYKLNSNEVKVVREKEELSEVTIVDKAIKKSESSGVLTEEVEYICIENIGRKEKININS